MTQTASFVVFRVRVGWNSGYLTDFPNLEMTPFAPRAANYAGGACRPALTRSVPTCALIFFFFLFTVFIHWISLWSRNGPVKEGSQPSAMRIFFLCFRGTLAKFKGGTPNPNGHSRSMTEALRCLGKNLSWSQSSGTGKWQSTVYTALGTVQLGSSHLVVYIFCWKLNIEKYCT